MRLRPATADDVATVVGWIDSEAAMVQWSGPGFAWPLTTDQVLARQEDPGAVLLVAEDAAGAVQALARVTERPERAARIGWVVVDPARRGSGIGRVFLPAIIDACFATGAERLNLGVLRHNTAARRLYRCRLGGNYTKPPASRWRYSRRADGATRRPRQIEGKAARIARMSLMISRATSGRICVDRSLSAAGGLSWTSMKKPSAPAAAAARASGRANCGVPPVCFPSPPGFCIECVMS